jgi:hypothetical protein
MEEHDHQDHHAGHQKEVHGIPFEKRSVLVGSSVVAGRFGNGLEVHPVLRRVPVLMRALPFLVVSRKTFHSEPETEHEISPAVSRT